MNARLYDAKLHRFLAPDNFIQDPNNSQGFNRYGYAWNNPLKFTDPSGEIIIPILIGIGVGILTNGISNSINDKPFFQGAVQAGIIGGISGAISFGIGSSLMGASGFAKVGMGVIAHGFSGAIISSTSGGNLGSGFAAGAIGSGIAGGIGASGISNHYWMSAAQIGGATVAGGTASVLSGGSFWDGARMGFITSALNHVAHMGYDDREPPYEYNGKTYESKGELYGAILVDQAAEQFGIKDIVALAAALDGTFPSINKPFTTPGSSSKTSYASKYGSELLPQKMPTKLPTHINTRTGKMAYTKVLGRFLGRIAGPVGWAILSYDVGMTLYNTQVIYNRITN